MPAVVGICAHCRRPNDEAEIAAALAAAVERRARPRRLAVRIVVLLALGAALFAGRDVLSRSYAALWRTVSDDVSAHEEPAPRAAAPAAAAAGLVGAPRPPGAAVSAAPPPPPEPVLGADDWTFAGRVFDLRTLKPVTRAKMIFACPERGLQRSAEIDELGRFAVGLPTGIGEGFKIEINAAGYDPDGLAEPDVPYAKLTDDERRKLIDSALAGDVPPTRVSEPQAGPRLELDVFLAPRATEPARP